MLCAEIGIGWESCHGLVYWEGEWEVRGLCERVVKFEGGRGKRGKERR